MEDKKLIARVESMEFFFTVEKKTAQEIEIIMYNTHYTLVNDGNTWAIPSNSKSKLSDRLVQAVISTIEQQEGL